MMAETSRTLVLTGASRGIGHATVQHFSERGWRIITCSREDIPPHCKADPNWTHHIPSDLANASEVERFVAQTLELLDGEKIHALVNNAAVSPKADDRSRLRCLNGSLEHWREVLELNLFAPLMLCRGLAEALAPQEASVVNITSIAGHYAHPFASSAYAVSKAALSALNRELAVECAALGVRVNAVAPGEIETDMIGAEYQSLLDRIPMGRMGTPEEVARCVYALCDGGFSYVTGAEIFITGGQHLL